MLLSCLRGTFSQGRRRIAVILTISKKKVKKSQRTECLEGISLFPTQINFLDGLSCSIVNQTLLGLQRAIHPQYSRSHECWKLATKEMEVMSPSFKMFAASDFLLRTESNNYFKLVLTEDRWHVCKVISWRQSIKMGGGYFGYLVNVILKYS